MPPRTLFDGAAKASILQHFGDNKWIAAYLQDKQHDLNKPDVRAELKTVLIKGLSEEQQAALAYPKTAIPAGQHEIRNAANQALSQKICYIQEHCRQLTAPIVSQARATTADSSLEMGDPVGPIRVPVLGGRATQQPPTAKPTASKDTSRTWNMTVLLVVMIVSVLAGAGTWAWHEHRHRMQAALLHQRLVMEADHMQRTRDLMTVANECIQKEGTASTWF
jgi:hypothetical protein